MLGLDASTPRGRIQRPVDDLADEVAGLYHDRSVRVVRLVDDNLLGPDPRSARAWLADLEAALRRRRVGTMAWRVMAEPSVLSDEVADAFARLGVLSVLVGIESLTPQGKSALGRRGRHEDDQAALRRLAQRGIAPMLNVLALRPDGTLADTRAELDGLAAQRCARVEAREIEQLADEFLEPVGGVDREVTRGAFEIDGVPELA